jgi:enoyl-CoA hydratase/carnithine racemase
MWCTQVGGAANIALANYHDIVLCSTKGRFMYPFAKLGLTPELGSSFMMPTVVGMTRAKHMMMAGEWFSAEQAKEMGLVLEVTAPEDLFARGVEMATKLAGLNQVALRGSKKLMNGHFRAKMTEVGGGRADGRVDGWLGGCTALARGGAMACWALLQRAARCGCRPNTRCNLPLTSSFTQVMDAENVVILESFKSLMGGSKSKL